MHPSRRQRQGSTRAAAARLCVRGSGWERMGAGVRAEAGGPHPTLFSKQTLWEFSFLVIKTKEQLEVLFPGNQRSSFATFTPTTLPERSSLDEAAPLPLTCTSIKGAAGRNAAGAASLQPGRRGSREQKAPRPVPAPQGPVGRLFPRARWRAHGVRGPGAGRAEPSVWRRAPTGPSRRAPPAGCAEGLSGRRGASRRRGLAAGGRGRSGRAQSEAGAGRPRKRTAAGGVAGAGAARGAAPRGPELPPQVRTPDALPPCPAP